MKQIQKLINDLFIKKDIKDYKIKKQTDTDYYLQQQRQKYLASAPYGFKTRTSADYFFSENNYYKNNY